LIPRYLELKWQSIEDFTAKTPRVEERAPENINTIKNSALLVPMLCVGMPSWTLRVRFRAATPDEKTTQSVEDGIPTEDRGNE
jgi:hypothetical protein